LELSIENLGEFPHENKAENTAEFFSSLFAKSEYEEKYIAEFARYLATFGLQLEELKTRLVNSK
jgi:hypothetical protein